VALAWLRPVATPGPPLRDFEAYYAAGATWRYGGDPYGREIWRVERHVPGVDASREELLPFVGPPFSLPLWGLFSLLPFSAAALAWGAVLVLAAAAVAFGSARLAGAHDAASLTAVALLAIAFGPLTSAAALGQVALVACAGVVLTTLALAARSVRGAIGAALAAALALAGSFAAAGGVTGLLRYATLLVAHADAERTIAIQITATAAAYGFGAADGAARVAGLAVAAIVVAVTAVLLRSRAYTREARVAVACAALPLVLPFAHEHDLVIALFPAIMCLRASRGAQWVVAAVDWLGLAQRPTGIAQSIVLALAAALAMIALARDRLGVAAVAPFVVVACAGFAGALATRHPLPIWPDALPPGFHAPLQFGTPAVWRLEQVRSGLADRSLTSAWLRSASLAGVLTLWGVSLAALKEPTLRRID
jgi:hypothetical protein